MLPIENAVVNLLKEQRFKKAEFDMHIQFDFLGLDDTPAKSMARYECMKILAARIIQIENLLEMWATYLDLAELMEMH